MDFTVLPHARLISPSSRSASISVANPTSNQTSSQTVNVVVNKGDDEPSVSVSVREPESKTPIKPQPDSVTADNPIATIKFLQLVLQSYIDNPIKYNGLIICTVSLLEQLIETITGCDDCSIELGDLDVTCCKQSKIQPVNKIWCRNGESSEIFKYRYSNLLQVFEQYKISLKLVYVED